MEQGVAVAVSRGWIEKEGQFLSVPSTEPRLRDRSTVLSPGLRRPEMISHREIAAGIMQVVTTNLGATDDEIVLSVSRLMGFKATSAQLKGVIAQAVERLLAEGRLMREATMLVVGRAPPVQDAVAATVRV